MICLTCDRQGGRGKEPPPTPAPPSTNAQQEVVITTKSHFMQGSWPQKVTI